MSRPLTSMTSTRVPARPRTPIIQPLLREVYGRQLRRLRRAQGRTLAEVAGLAGISMAYLSEVERGLKEPSSEIIAAVCGALDATVVDLVGAAHEELRALAEAVAREALVLDLTSGRAAPVRRPEPATPGESLDRSPGAGCPAVLAA
ncbi:helix-turn-helix transcriptional regulator [Intrasporangium sp. DVR]|uniref:helix-turn-helix domain-containing protein n=1 Tax=Intrasporangium sp. DVR TaxID=3127867 RepID=UPI00313A668F